MVGDASALTYNGGRMPERWKDQSARSAERPVFFGMFMLQHLRRP